MFTPPIIRAVDSKWQWRLYLSTEVEKPQRQYQLFPVTPYQCILLFLIIYKVFHFNLLFIFTVGMIFIHVSIKLLNMTNQHNFPSVHLRAILMLRNPNCK